MVRDAWEDATDTHANIAFYMQLPRPFVMTHTSQSRPIYASYVVVTAMCRSVSLICMAACSGKYFIRSFKNMTIKTGVLVDDVRFVFA